MEEEDSSSLEEDKERESSGGVTTATVAALLMAAAVAIMPVWLSGAGGSFKPDVWQTFYGDLHPLLLPDSDGVFVLILVMEVCGLLSFGKWKPQTTFPLFVGVIFAVMAAIAGNFMHLRITESDGTGFHHIWGFTVFVILAILTFVTKIWENHTGARSPIYGIMLILAIGALGFTGLQGGVLQWKAPFEAPLAALRGDGTGESGIPAQVVAPPAEDEAAGVIAPPAPLPPEPVVAPVQAVETPQAPPQPVEASKPPPAPAKPVDTPKAPVVPPKKPVVSPAKPIATPATPVAAPPKPAPPANSPQKAVPDRLAYEDVVKPILRSRCYECHAAADQNPLGKKKIKGSLVMTSIEDMKEGGSEAEALVPGDLEASLMHVRIHLPMDDDEHMPPEDKDQLGAHEIEILDWWIKAGAPTVSLKEAMAGAPILAAVAKMVPPEVRERERAAATAAAAKAKAEAEAKRKALESAMVQASQAFPNALTFVSRESSDLQFTAVSMRRDFTDENLALLKPVADGLVEVNLGSTSVTNGGLTHLAGMPNLTKLHLQQTKVTDEGLETISKLRNLEWLNLFGTEVTDAGLRKLESLPKLKKVYVWGTKVTPDGAEALRAKLPDCEVNLGTGS